MLLFLLLAIIIFVVIILAGLMLGIGGSLFVLFFGDAIACIALVIFIVHTIGKRKDK